MSSTGSGRRSISDRFESWLVRTYVWGPSQQRRPGPSVSEEPTRKDDRPVTTRVALFVLGVALPALVAIALIPLRDVVSSSTATLVLVLPVLFATIVAGRTAGIVAAIVAALSYDVFLTRPYYSFTIDAANDVESALVLGGISLVVSMLVSTGLQARGRATSRAAELEALVAAAQVAASGDGAAMAARIEDLLTDYLGLRRCDWSPGFEGTVGHVLERSGRIAGVDEARLPDGYLEVPVVHGTTHLGRIVMRTAPSRDFSLEERRTVVAIADVFAAGLVASGTDDHRG
jgi:hypothetical protein